MAWTYCKCGHEFNEPTVEQVLEQSMTCPECSREVDPVKTVNQLIGELVERIEELERRNHVN